MYGALPQPVADPDQKPPVKRSLIVSALACVLAAPAAAQDPSTGTDVADEAPRRISVSLGVGGGTVVGLWRDLSSRARIGVDAGAVTVRRDGDQVDDEFTSLVIHPAVHLLSGAGAVRPYTAFGPYAQYARQSAGTDVEGNTIRVARREVGARAGAGLQWRPVNRVAVRGHVGVSAGYLSDRTEGSSLDRFDSEGWTAGTFSSGIELHLYF